MAQSKEIPPAIAFALQNVTTEQFAIIGDNYNASEEVSVLTKLRFAQSFEQHRIGVFVKFTFTQDGKDLLIIEVGCHFRIHDVNWPALVEDQDAAQIRIPVGLALHFAAIVVGTARGVLHARTMNTLFSQMFLPTMDLTKDLREDVLV